MPSGSWFYLNGSHHERSGIAVIEKSNRPDWTGPEGFELTEDRSGFRPVSADSSVRWNQMDVPGCIAVVAEPGDLICFAALTYHANMATQERRYSCGMGFRPKREKIDAPWPFCPRRPKRSVRVYRLICRRMWMDIPVTTAHGGRQNKLLFRSVR